MAGLALACRVATTFTQAGDIDEDAMRQYLQRFIDTNIEIYLASGGSGEGHALKWDELRRVYEIGVAVGRGKIAVHANPPEQYTGRATLEQSLLAVQAGVDIVNIYGPAGWHGYRPTDEEYVAYYDWMLPQIKHPVAIAPNPTQGYTPKFSLVADLCNRHTQVAAVNLVNLNETYFINLKAAMKRDVALYVPLKGAMNCFTLGAAGMVGGEINLTPKTFRQYADLYTANKVHDSGQAFRDLTVVRQYTAPWGNISARSVKMFMHVLKLPGWQGGLREPCLMPSPAVMEKFADGLLRLGVAEIDELAREAGIAVPS